MNKKNFIAVLLAIIAVSVFAEEVAPLTANIKVSPNLGREQCATQPGIGITLLWNGAEDKRLSPSVGVMKVKKEEQDVKMADGVNGAIGEALKNVFVNCGFAVDTKKETEGIAFSADVVEFFAGSQKKFLTGETTAKGSLVLHFEKGGATYDFNLGATKSDKRLKKKSIKQLEDVLTGLLEEMALQVSSSPVLFEEVKKMANK